LKFEESLALTLFSKCKLKEEVLFFDSPPNPLFCYISLDVLSQLSTSNKTYESLCTVL
jgi:hypothetical protein